MLRRVPNYRGCNYLRDRQGAATSPNRTRKHIRETLQRYDAAFINFPVKFPNKAAKVL